MQIAWNYVICDEINTDDKVMSNVITFVYDDYAEDETKKFHLPNADAAKQ